MDDRLKELWSARSDVTTFYAPFNFIRSADAPTMTDVTVKEPFEASLVTSPHDHRRPTVEGTPFHFWLRALDWDSAFFGFPTYRLDLALFPRDADDARLVAALRLALENRRAGAYVFAEVPSEDVPLLRALGEVGFRLIETRLTYFRDDLSDLPEVRYPIRIATADDSDHLAHVAAVNRNEYDRFHADPRFEPSTADRFLAEFARASLEGFADLVIVPDEGDGPPGAFLTGQYLRHLWTPLDVRVSRMVLSAVGPERRGWYFKLVSELSWILRESGTEVICMTTQSTNRAVIRTWEKLGYRLGRTTHVLSRNLP